MEIATLGLKHTEDIKQLLLRIFSGEPWNDSWDERQLELYVLELIANKNSLSIGLYEDGDLIGLSLGRVRHWYEGTEYWIDEFGVVPEKQKKGYGSKFLEEIQHFVAGRDIAAMVLLTERTVPACHFYKKNGFAVKEEQVFMVKELC